MVKRENMKIQCDVCEKEEASVFCSADEAVLCHGCDRRVHRANKLACRHLRFSLHHPSSKADSPSCDICQERRAVLFCLEDRAILCRECDSPIHKANEHTQKHSRFLLTGIKLSVSTSSSYQTSSSSNGSSAGTETENETKSSVTEKKIIQSISTNCKGVDICGSQDGASVGTSSIAEYLMETLPGWHVEDFLDPSCSPYGFCKGYNHILPENELGCTFGSFSSKDLPIWVPQASSQSHHLPQIGALNGLIKGSEEVNSVMKASRKWSEDGCKVPQIGPPYIKKARQFL